MNKIDDRQQTKTWSALVVDIFSNAIVSLQGPEILKTADLTAHILPQRIRGQWL